MWDVLFMVCAPFFMMLVIAILATIIIGMIIAISEKWEERMGKGTAGGAWTVLAVVFILIMTPLSYYMKSSPGIPDLMEVEKR